MEIKQYFYSVSIFKGNGKSKKSGKVTIIAKYLKKNYKCIVTVTNAKDDDKAIIFI